jgi:hypothetical protein
MIKRMGRASALFYLFFMSLALLSASPAFSGEIIIKPGKFDHFNINLPERIIAGEKVSVTLQAVDSLNNLIGDFGTGGREFQISISGSASVEPASLKSMSFENGAAAFFMKDKVVEPVTLTVHENGKPIPVLTRELFITPGKTTSYDITAARAVVSAGQPVSMKITAKDAFGNKALDQVLGRNLTITFKGDADPRLVGDNIPDLMEGITNISVSSEKTGFFMVEVKDLINGSAGVGEKVEVVNGPVNSFRLFTPKEVIAGEPFEVSIVALDRFANVAANYPLLGRGVDITSSGILKPFPSSVPAYEFVNGEAKVSLRYDAAGDIELSVQEQDGSCRSLSDMIRLLKPIPERYAISTPGAAVAGQKFKLKITAYNQLDHVIRNYNIVGPDVELVTTGSGSLVPNRIPASEFVNGSSVVEVQYNKSEAFSINAVPLEKESAVPPVVSKQATTSDRRAAVHQKAGKIKKSKKAEEEVKKKTEEINTQSPLELTGISLVEPKKKSTVYSTVFIHLSNIDSRLKFKIADEMVKGEKQIVLRLNNTTNKLDNDMKFDSAYIRKVSVESAGTNNEPLTIRFQLVKPMRYSVIKGKNALKVSLIH